MICPRQTYKEMLHVCTGIYKLKMSCCKAKTLLNLTRILQVLDVMKKDDKSVLNRC